MDNKPKEFTRVLFCTDHSENADHAFVYALDAVVKRPGCRLSILHVIPETEAQFWKSYVYEVDDVDSKAKNDLDARMKTAYLDQVPEGVEVEVIYRVGKDWQEIVDCAAQTGADLLVIGRQGSSALQKALFGNVTEKVVRKAACAVLVVPMSYIKRH